MFEFRPPAVVKADADLTLAFRRGDEDAVRELFDRYGGLVHAISVGATDDGSPECAMSADQITVHTFLQAWRNSEAFEPGQPFAPWLAGLTRSVANAAGFRLDDSVVEPLLADPAGWIEPAEGVEGRTMAAIVAEAHVDPTEIYTAADLAAARSGASSRTAVIRAAILGLVGGLVLLLVVVLALSSTGGSSNGETTTVDLRPTGRILDVDGSIQVEQVASGLSIRLETSPLPDLSDGGSYQAWVLLDDETIVSAGSFAGGEDDVNVELSAAVAEGDGAQFVVVAPASDISPTVGMLDDADVIFRAPLP